MSDTTTQEAPAVATTNASNASSADIAELYKHLLATKAEGKPDVLGPKLLRQNRQLGEQLRDAQAKLAAAEAKVAELEPLAKKSADVEKRLAEVETKLIPDDHVAIPKADADALEAYRALGADPVKVKASLERLPTLEGEIARRDREKELGAVAKVMGYDEAVLLDRAEGKTFVPAKAKLHGKEYDSFEVVDADEAGKERRRPIADVEAADWAKYLPALKPEGNAASARTLPVGGSPYRGNSRPTPETPRQADARTAADADRNARLRRELSALPLI